MGWHAHRRRAAGNWMQAVVTAKRPDQRTGAKPLQIERPDTAGKYGACGGGRCGRRPSGPETVFSDNTPFLTPCGRGLRALRSRFRFTFTIAQDNVVSLDITRSFDRARRQQAEEAVTASKSRAAATPQARRRGLHRVAHRLDDQQIPVSILLIKQRSNEFPSGSSRVLRQILQTDYARLSPVGCLLGSQAPPSDNADSFAPFPIRSSSSRSRLSATALTASSRTLAILVRPRSSNLMDSS